MPNRRGRTETKASVAASEINRLVPSLRDRERTLVLLAAGTGLRMSELFGLKWGDVDFAGKQVSVLRSIAEGKRSRHKGHAGTASACVYTRDTRHVHAGCYGREAWGSNRGRPTVLPECEDCLGNRRPN
jgi:integrase